MIILPNGSIIITRPQPAPVVPGKRVGREPPPTGPSVHELVAAFREVRLSRYYGPSDERALAESIICQAARRYNVPVREVTGPRRTKRIVAARHAAINEIYEACPTLSTPDIASFFGLDHTSVIYALGRKGGRKAAA